jgi:hypothetical protein
VFERFPVRRVPGERKIRLLTTIRKNGGNGARSPE